MAEKERINPMMRRPIVQEDIVHFLRTRQKQTAGELGRVASEAREKGVPIIPHETAVFLEFFLKQIKPKNVLEIGAAIGFSSSLMANCLPENSHVTTIDRYDMMIAAAKKTYERLNLQEKVTLLEGEAVDILSTLPSDTYDFVFMDSAKSKYIVFLPDILRIMKRGAVLMVDDIFQAGDVLKDIQDIKRNQRAIHRGLNQFFDAVIEHPQLTSTILPLGDGVILITKDDDEIILPKI
ncbi:Predicted O-methyltransferase YrrM [Pilibacter termitis]|uniref:tRNA 5-hydroxyuridine methyltransferase n=1 Tax=Pilibacter termitis TaxID=263852 RepID=A0A1T4Q8D2_9ENTE|nr:O-methyltransferase [Pilibacter termitis]SKA00013.1 Predicted O-methyltransferase YrrM [Pilibacter termitis]